MTEMLAGAGDTAIHTAGTGWGGIHLGVGSQGLMGAMAVAGSKSTNPKYESKVLATLARVGGDTNSGTGIPVGMPQPPWFWWSGGTLFPVGLLAGD